jgi:hypothetical protein
MSSAGRSDPRAGTEAAASRREASGPAHAVNASSLLRAAARRLETCARDWNGTEHAPRLARALHLHRRLWAALEAEVTGSTAGLPAGILDALLRVARFIDVWTAEVLAHPEPTRLRGMIEIDRGLATLLASLPREPRVDVAGLREAA